MDFPIQINTVWMGNINFKGSQVERGTYIKGLFSAKKLKITFHQFLLIGLLEG